MTSDDQHYPDRVVHQTQSFTTLASPSGVSLDVLTLRQLLVLTAVTHQRPIVELADLLGCSRMTCYRDLAEALDALRAFNAPEPDGDPQEPREPYYGCPEHGSQCGLDCGHLRAWMGMFDDEWVGIHHTNGWRCDRGA